MGELRFRQIHLDFHTSEKIVGVGRAFDAERFAKTLADAAVDSVTCFSRCHHGMIYHDTRFEARHPGLEINLLKEQIDACHAYGIRVPIYISVGWDEFCAKRHPEWLEVNPKTGGPNGAPPLSPGWHNLCFNSPYVEYVIEQTHEVLSMFEVDGLFFDIVFQGECVCPRCLEGMRAAGLNPESAADRIAFAQRVTDDFKRRMTREVRRVNADCTIFYNAGHVGPAIRRTLETYTHLELESLPSGGWGYDHFPITVRYARNLGLDCLGMTGKFHRSWGDFGSFKNRAALEYECFVSLANNARCSIGDQLHPTGAISEATYELVGSVYRQVAAKEPFCHGAEAVTEVAIFTPEAIGKADGRVDPSLAGAYRMLLEDHQQFDVIDAEMAFERYALIVLPDKIELDRALEAKLERYLAQGGKLLASHRSGLEVATSRFFDALGVRYKGEAEYSPDYVVPRPALSEGIPATEHVMYDRAIAVEPVGDAEVLADIWRPYFNRTFEHFCSHRQTPPEARTDLPAAVRTARTVYFAHPIFAMYRRWGTRVYKQLVLNALRLLFDDPVVRTDAPTTAHITLNIQRELGRYVLHILHYIPERRCQEIDTIEDVIPLHDVRVALKLPAAPRRVYLAPSEEEIPFTFDGRRAHVVIPRVTGHQMVVFE
ncbi:MAG TPA: beta-galactosidase trimerization domain-containing protein [Limnochordia bacterium]